MSSPGFGPRAQRSIQVASEMIAGYRFAEACVFLFQLNKYHIEEWVYVVDALKHNADRSLISITATIVRCSAMKDLSACEYLVPGLSQYTIKTWNPELLD
jgi:hypothetical protein